MTAPILGEAVMARQPLHGGDLSAVSLVTLANGREVVVKEGPLVAVEGRMLTRLAAVGAPVPEVLEAAGERLVLECLPEGRATQDGWAILGETLAQLHATAPKSGLAGWDEDYAFGAVAIPNTDRRDWSGFYATSRLGPALSHLPVDLARRLEAVIADLPSLIGGRPLGLLHGDLWSGNLLFATDGTPYLIDPACYFGDPEVDLAMLALFGQVPPVFWAAYGMLDAGWEERREVYQIWPALVHYRLFGAGYRGMIEARLTALGH